MNLKKDRKAPLIQTYTMSSENADLQITIIRQLLEKHTEAKSIVIGQWKDGIARIAGVPISYAVHFVDRESVYGEISVEDAEKAVTDRDREAIQNKSLMCPEAYIGWLFPDKTK